MDRGIKDILRVSILNWFVLMAKEDYDKNDSTIADAILKLNKYLERRKQDIVAKYDKALIERKLNDAKHIFEKLIVKPEYHKDLDKDIDLPTINYSPTLLAIQALDDLLLNDNIEFRVRFGHINTGSLLIQIEEYDGNLTMDSMKLYSNLTKELGL
jgi:hypothetical protein